MTHRPIKILYTIPNFDTAGSGKVVYDLVKYIDKSIFSPEICVFNTKGKLFKEIELLGVPIHVFEFQTSYKPYLTLFSRVLKIRNFFKKNQYHIVHSWHWNSDWTEALAAKLAGVKWIYTKKAMSWGNNHWQVRSLLADYIVTINDKMYNYFPWKKHQKLIPIGIDVDYYQKEFYKESKKSDIYHMITVSNLVPVKGIETLLEALSNLDEAFKLSIVGDDSTSYALFLKTLVEDLNLSSNVSFIGKKNDVRPFLAQADLFIMPSKKEGFGVALVEAMSMELMVLGSNTTGISYILEDFNELLFKVGDSIGLKTAIKRIMHFTETETEVITKRLRAKCLDKFSLRKFINLHQKLYEEIQ